MAGDEPSPLTFFEAVLNKHYEKVPHSGGTGRHIWKCLLPGCCRGKPYSAKEHINRHWIRDHKVNMQLALPDISGPKSDRRTAKADPAELARLCDTQSGNFPNRWVLKKLSILDSKRAEVRVFYTYRCHDFCFEVSSVGRSPQCVEALLMLYTQYLQL
jgi:hypothetical protein